MMGIFDIFTVHLKGVFTKFKSNHFCDIFRNREAKELPVQ